MPRATQSKEGAIIAFFRTQPLEIAQVVHKLAGEALKERTQRSSDAKARAAKAAQPLPAALGARPAHKAKPKAQAKPKVSKPKPAPAPPYTEADVNGD